MDDFSAWLGHTEEKEDRLDPARANVLLAAFGEPAGLREGDTLPPLHHWLHFWEARTPEETGADGHPRRGLFFPPVPLPRRMWAGGRLIFRAPLRLGDRVRRVSTIRSIATKAGRSGELLFVTVAHLIHTGDALAIEEEQDLVYRGEGGAPSSPPESDLPAPDRVLPTDPVLLFRYSALTMNAHRIHYDAPYASGAEHYPGLVVQGPLQATALAALAATRLGGTLRAFRFRGLAPAFAGTALGLHAAPREAGLALWASQNGVRTMAAEADS